MLWGQELQDLEEIMESLRHAIGKKDEQLAHLLEQRYKLVEGIWMMKDDKGVPHRDKEREEQMVRDLAKKTGLNYDFLSRIYGAIFDENERRYNGL